MSETWLFYLVSQREYEIECPTGCLGIDLLSTNKNKEVVDIFKSRTSVTQGKEKKILVEYLRFSMLKEDFKNCSLKSQS